MSLNHESLPSSSPAAAAASTTNGQGPDRPAADARAARARRLLRRASAAAVWEHLEGRTMMSVSTWTGAGIDGNFSTPGNWAGNAAPAAGADVTFGTGAASQAVTVDGPATVGAVDFEGGGYALTGSDPLTVAGGMTAVGGDDTVWTPVTLAGSQTVSAGSGTNLTLSGDVDDGGNGYGLTKTGPGALGLTGTDTFVGPVDVTGGTLRVDGLMLADVDLSTGTALAGTGIVGSVTSNGGIIVPGDTGTGDGTLTSTGSVSLDANTRVVLSLDGNTPGNGPGNYGQVSTGGDVALNGATLQVTLGADYTPAAGDVLTLVNNGGSGPVTGTFANLPEGSLMTLAGSTFRISYAGGDGNDVTLTYVRSTAVVVTTDTAPAAHGQTVTFTAAVTATDGQPGTPTGTVQFYDNGTALGAARPVDGSGNATLAVSNLTTGTHAVTAVYSGDPTFQTGTSAALSQVVTASATATALTSGTGGSSVHGQSVTFTATVTTTGGGTGTPAGTVTFKDGAAVLGTGTLNGSGVATFTTSTLSTATHSITAVYGGGGDFAASTSAPVSQAVAKASAGLTVSSNTATSVFGQAVVYTVSAAATAPGAGVPTGTVTFKNGATVLGTVTLNGSGAATFTNTGLPVGTDTVTAVYNGSANYLTVTSSGLTQTVTATATRAVVTSSLATSVWGQSVTLSAILASVAPGSGVPTGNVSFYDGGTLLGTVAAASGRATLATGALSVGSHAITAQYAGDGNHSAVTSAAFAQHVNKAALTVAVTSSAPSAVWGQPVTYTVTANAAAPGAGTPDGGTVTLTDENGNTIGTGTLSGGSATIAGTQLAVGSHTVTATYAGDADFDGGVSPAAAQAVAKAAATVAVSSSASPTVAGQPVTFTAAVSVNAPGAGTPTGTVSFYDGDLNHLLGTGNVSAGSATFTTTALSTSTHTVFAVYGGDAHVAAATSPTMTQAANQDTTTTVVVSSSGGSGGYGATVSFTATVSADAPGSGTPTGAVTFYDGVTQIGSPVTLAGGTAAIPTDALTVGTHSITAVYGGDADFSTSTSGAVTQTVAQAATTAAVTMDHPTSVYGQPVTYTVTVTPAAAGTPTGSVTFYDGNANPLGTASLTNGSASLAAPTWDPGSPQIYAVYAGDANFTGSTSPSVTQTVNAAATTTTVTSSAPAAAFGQPVTLTATVATTAPGTGLPVGATVTFYQDGNTLGTGTVAANGTATLTGVTPAIGSHAITAAVAATADYATSTSAPITQAVAKAGTALTLGATAGTVYGQAATLTAALAVTAPGAGTPTGTVTFYADGTLLGTAPVTGGTTATLTNATLAVGGHTITASYGGDASFTASTTAASVTQTVAHAATGTTLTIDHPTSVYGQAVTYSVAVSATAPGAGTPTGTVTFYDYYGDNLGTATLAAGSATIASTTWTPGTQQIQAVYNGDASFAGSSSSIVNQTVSADTTTTTVTSSIGTSSYGQAVTFTAAVAADAPGAGTRTGTVVFRADGVQIGTTQTLANGTASVTVGSLAVGTPTITAEYTSGDGNFTDSVSGGLTQTVSATATTVTLASTDAANAVTGEPVVVTATVAPAAGSGVPTGTVTFSDNGVQVGSPVALVNGAATLAGPFAVGTHPLTATYTPADGDFVTSTTAAALSQVVSQDGVGVAVTASTASPVFGQGVTLTATVSAAAPGAGTPTGTVTFYADGTSIGTGTLSAGVATFATSSLPVGARDVTASYGGDADFLATPSADHAVDVTVGRASTTVTLGSTTNSTFGAPASFTATVTATAPGAGTPTGTVTFYADGDTANPLGSVAVNGSGVATLATAALSAGDHTIMAGYAGDVDFVASTTASGVTQHVAASNTLTTLGLSSATTAYDTGVTMTATVAASGGGGGTPIGIVDFFDGQDLLGTGTLVNGQTSFTAWGLTVGAHSLRATYTGDLANNYVPSSSPLTGETVSPGATATALTSSVNPSAVGQQVTFTAAVTPAGGTYGPGVTAVGGTVSFYDNATLLGTGTVDGTGHATFATSALAVAGHPVTATYGGDARYATSTSAPVAQTVQQGHVTISISSSAQATAVFGQPVTLTAAVNAVLPAVGNPTGTVTFFDNGVPIGSAAAITAGQAQVVTSGLTVGSHTITATYNGDANFLTGTSLNFGQIVGKDGSTVAVVSDHNPAVAGQTVDFTATVSAAAPGAGTPTGTVTFYADGVAIAGGTNVALTNGTASVSTNTLSTAGHAITVVYGGDGNFTGNTSNTLTQSQNQDATAVAINVGTGLATYGQPVSISATVTAVGPGSGTPTGTVTFYDVASGSPVSLGQATLANGLAQLSGLAPHFGSHSIEAVYSGDTDFATATSAASTVYVSAATTTTTLSGDVGGVYGQPLNLTATVAAVAPGGGTPTGTVAFYDQSGTNLLGSVTLANGIATLTQPLTVGVHGVTVVYTPGSTDYTASNTASAGLVTVAQASTTTALSAPTGTVYGQSASLTATVSPVAPGAGVPTGSVSFFDGFTLLQTVNLDGAGQATLTTAGLAVGSHPITAQYTGDANFTPGGPSATATQVVGLGQLTGTITAPQATTYVGDAVTFTATFAAVAPAVGTPTGTVTFYDNNTGSPVSIGTAPLDSNGTAQLTLNGLAAGNYSVTAAVDTDGNFAAATTPALAHTVAKVTPAVTVSPTSDVVYGQPATLSVTVNAPSQTNVGPTGTVTFYADGVQVGAAQQLVGGQASVSTDGLAVGPHAVTAVYSGDAKFLGGTSGAVTQTVDQDGTAVALSSDTNPAVAGQTVGFQAVVTAAAPGAGTPTGTVTFYADGVALGTPVVLDPSGTAVLATSVLSTTGHTITAVYNGDADFLTATSNALSQAQNRDDSTVTLSLNGGTGAGVYGQSLGVSATVSAAAPGSGSPTGSVTFYDESGASPVSLGQATVTNGVAVLAGLSLSVGDHPIAAVYSGDADFAPPATAPSGTLTVSAADTAVTLAGPAAGVFGQPLTVTASVAAVAPGSGTPTGSIALYDGDPADGGTLVATHPVDGTGSASFAGAPTVGAHSLYAKFIPDGVNFNGSTSAADAVTVSKAATTATVAATAPTAAGQTTLMATLAVTAPGAGAPTGTVSFYDGTTLLGTAPLANGTASKAVSGLVGGDHAIKAVYGGDGNFLSATSAVATTHVPLPGTLGFSTAAESISEAGQVAVLTVTRTGGTEGAVSVAYAVTGGTATNGTNYHLTGGTLQFAAGQASATISVPVVDDGRFDQDKSLVLTLSNPTGGASLGAAATNTLTIANADAAPTVSVDSVTVAVSKTGTVLPVFQLTLSAPSNLPTTVHFKTVDGSATAGVDYTPVEGVATFPAGTTVVPVGVYILPTTDYRPTRTFGLSVYSPINANLSASAATGTGTILNTNYPAPTVGNVSATVAPGAQATFNPLATAGSFDNGPMTVSVPSQPAYGSVAVTGGTLTYTPAAGSFNGDSFQYVVTDDKGDTAVGTATVSVAGIGLVASPITAGAQDLVVVGTAGNDTIAFKLAAGVKNGIRVTMNGTTSAAFTVTGRLIAVGGAGNDVITAAGMTKDAWFYGGAGNDKLTGGAGNDVLIGGDGNDALAAAGGRNILLGGTGADTLNGTGAADILVADATSYDVPTPASQVSMAALQTNWVVHKVRPVTVSAGLSTTNGAQLSAATITPDGSADVLVGKPTDWYFGDFTFGGGTTTFSDGRHGKAGQTLTPTKAELVTDL